MKLPTPSFTLAVMATLVVALQARAAHADKSIVVIGGSADVPRRGVVDDAIKTTATKAGWSVVPSPLTKQETQHLLSCSDPTLYPCVPPSLERHGIDRVFVIKVDAGTTVGGEPQWIIDASLIASNPPSLVADKKHCDHCADDQLATASAALAQGMIRELAIRSGRTVLDVKTTPQGARILLDGEQIGFTNGRFNTYPGHHQITLEKPGFLTKTKEFAIEEGATASIDETLDESGIANSHDHAAHRSRLPYILLGAGVVGVGSGIALIVLDEDPMQTNRRHYLRSTGWGIAVGVAGVGALAASYFTWRASKRHSAPTVSFVPGGAVVGWSKSL